MRYEYSSGHKSRQAAEEALEESYATGDVVLGERPEIESYRSKVGKRRWRITLAE